MYLLNQVTLLICERLGIPVAFEKLEGPFTQISFLGIVLDSEAHQLSLPQDKLQDILQMVQSWLEWHKSAKWELLFLIGKLSCAAKVVPAGCLFFLLHLIDLSLIDSTAIFGSTHRPGQTLHCGLTFSQPGMV